MKNRLLTFAGALTPMVDLFSTSGSPFTAVAFISGYTIDIP